MSNPLAVQLHAAGLKVFPCAASKAPAVPKDVDWRDVAKQAPDKMQWRSPFVGVPVPKGVVVIDLDTYKGTTREEVERILGCRLPWDKALIQRTQSGGEHYAFRADWPCKQGSDLCRIKGFDTRVGERGYIATGPGYSPVGFGLYSMAHPSNLPILPKGTRRKLEDVEPPPRKQHPVPDGRREVSTVRDALRHIDPACGRAEWLRVGLALRQHFHDDPEGGLALFDQWSSGALTESGQEPDNYSAETMDHQWRSFKPDGGITIGTLFYSAISNGWQPPTVNAIETAAAFGPVRAPSKDFNALVDRITEQGGNPKSTDDLIEEVRAIQCNELQRGVLLAALHRELKDAGLLTPAVKEALNGSIPKAVKPLRGQYDKNHTENAATFLDSHYPDGNLIRSEQVWYTFNGLAWEMLDDDDVQHQLAKAMAPSKPQHSTVSGTLGMMSCLTHKAGSKIGDINPALILMQNGVLNTDTGELLPHDRRYFTTNILPYRHTPGAHCPRWWQFMVEVFEGDVERINLLQEWLGYLLSNSYDHQKVMLLLGPRRSGKGTIGKIIKILVGDQNYTGGTLSSFAKDSYLDSLRTKTVVFIGDAAKNVPRHIIDLVTERIKGISGCDDQNFSRKYKSDLTERLPSRITIAANNVPRLFDDSGALASRMLVLPFNVSWYDREDPKLFQTLVGEIEGIAQWALAGLARLRSVGRFTMPESSLAEIEYISEAYSPLQQFKNQCCETGVDAFTGSGEAYDAYRAWALNSGEDSVLNRRPFISSFKDLLRGTGVTYSSYREGRGFRGLRLLPVPTNDSKTAQAFKVVK